MRMLPLKYKVYLKIMGRKERQRTQVPTHRMQARGPRGFGTSSPDAYVPGMTKSCLVNRG